MCCGICQQDHFLCRSVTSGSSRTGVTRLCEFELPGEAAIMRKEGERLIIEPAPPRSLLALLATLAPLDEEFPPIRERAARCRRVLMRYLLDTNIVSDLVRDPKGRVADRTREVGDAQVCTSIIVAAELHYGALWRRKEELIRARLERSGRPIGGNDL
jgi:tRNA(fMet)-specific endonuclease VapC